MIIIREENDHVWYEIVGPLAHHPKTSHKMKEGNIIKLLEDLVGQTLDLIKCYAKRTT